MSFQLIDHIGAFTPKTSAAGILRVPASCAEFPLSLVVEAVGQLASCVAMESADFALRPVAAIAGKVVAHREIRPGDRLDLSIEVGALRTNAVRYDGVARIGDRAAVELHRFTGAMLPMEAFDDPEHVRELLRTLRADGLAPRSFPSRTEFAPTVTREYVDDEGRGHATLEAPVAGSFYADHFPRRPVYPATLLLDAKIAIAQKLITRGHAPDVAPPAVRAVHGVKVRAFTPPGGRVDVVVEDVEAAREDGRRSVKMEAFTAGARVSTATVLLEPSTP